MDIDRYEHGVPCWVDIGTSDIDGAISFYSSLFGWAVERGGPEMGGYSLATLRGRTVAGFGPQQNPGPPFWMTYVSVTDADAVLARVKEAGGSVLMGPMDVMDVGRMAVVADNVGAAISIWQPGQHPGAGVANEHGAYAWSELVTTDVEASKAFYGAVFGWGSETHEMGPMSYTEWKVGDRSVGGMMPKPPQMPAGVPPHWGVYFLVDDVDGELARVVELGGRVVAPVMDIEPGRFAVVSDPQGARFHIMTMKEPPS